MIPHGHSRRPAPGGGFPLFSARGALIACATWILSASVLATAAAAQSIEVGGRVVAGGRPVEGAVVELRPYEDRFSAALRRLAGDPAPVAASAETAEDGRFTIAAPEPGMWFAVVSHPGYVPMRAWLAPLVEPHDLRDAPLPADVGLAVQVVDESGRAVAGAEVRVEEGFFESFRRQPPGWDVALRYGKTDERGRVRLPRRAGEGLDLAAWAPGRRETELRVEPGDSGTVTITLPAGLPRPLRVRDGDQPAAGVVVRLGDAGWPAAVTGEDGTATLHVAPDGSARVELDAGGGWRTEPADVPPVEGRGEAAAPAGTQPPPPLPPLVLDLPAPWTVSGIVIAAHTGDPLPGALAWPRGDSADFVRTDARGRFQLVRVAREPVEVGAVAPGYVSDRLTVGPHEREVPRLALQPNAAVAGVVVDPAGEPVARAEIWLRDDAGAWVPWSTQAGPDRLAPKARTWTDEAGRFRFTGFRPGDRFDLRAQAAGFAPLGQTVEAGAAQLRLVLEEGRRVSGRVIGEDGEPVAGARVGFAWVPEARPLTVVYVEGLQVFDHQTTSDAEGRFVAADLPPGEYDAVVDARPAWALRELPGVRVPEEGGVDLGEVELQRAVALDLRVVDTDGEPIAGAEVSRPASSDGRRASGVMSSGGGDLHTDDEGRVRLTGLTPGEPIHLNVDHREYRRKELPGIVPPLPDELEVVLDRGLTLYGRVIASDGRPAAGASAQLTQEWVMAHSGGSYSRTSHGSVQVDENGAFRQTGVEPAPRMELQASWQGERGSLVLSDLPEEGEVGPLEIRLQGAPRLAGTVTLPGGEPAAGAEVSLWRNGEDRPGRSPDQRRTTADALGRFELLAEEPGLTRVEATLDDLTAGTTVELVPGTTEVALRLELPDRPGVSGRVVDTEGRPIQRAGVQLQCIEGCDGSHGRGTDEAGEFAFRDQAPGRYRLSAHFRGLASAEREVDLTGGFVRGIELVLRPGAAVLGTISGVDAEHLPAVDVAAAPAEGGRRMHGVVDHQGGYRIEGLSPGAWRVTARSEETGRAAEGIVDIRREDEVARLDLELDVEGVHLSGVLTLDGRPRADVRLHLSREDEGGRRAVAEARTAFDGSFRFAGVEPGRYRLDVRPQIGVPPTTRVVDLTGDREIRLDLEIAVVAGRVVAPAGVSLSGLRAVLADPHGGELYAEVTPDGRFHFAAVTPGPYTLSLRRGETPLHSQSLEVPPTDLPNLVIVLDGA